MIGRDVEIVVAEDPVATAAEHIVGAARAGGDVALSGGSSAGALYERCARLEPDWSRVDLWWVDDRAVPPDHDHSNYRLVSQTLLAHVESQPRAALVHRIEGELSPADAADRYDAALAGVELELALMGIGPDGHTASLFPHGPELEERERRAVASEARLEPFVPRVTMTIPFLARTQLMVYLVTGESKADAVRRAFVESRSPATPASIVRGRRTVAVLDRSAAARLDH